MALAQVAIMVLLANRGFSGAGPARGKRLGRPKHGFSVDSSGQISNGRRRHASPTKVGPDMVVAVSGAGGLGSLPGTPLTPQKLREGARPRARTRVCERTVFARHQALPVAATFE